MPIHHEIICAHVVAFVYKSKSKHAKPNDTDIDHVQKLIIENYNQGELNTNVVINGRSYNYRGWWYLDN